MVIPSQVCDDEKEGEEKSYYLSQIPKYLEPSAWLYDVVCVCDGAWAGGGQILLQKSGRSSPYQHLLYHSAKIGMGDLVPESFRLGVI